VFVEFRFLGLANVRYQNIANKFKEEKKSNKTQMKERWGERSNKNKGTKKGYQRKIRSWG
jgi:hypothetical protein